MEDTRTPQHDGSDQYSKKAATSGKPTLTSDDDHVPAPAPHVGGDPPRAFQTFTRFLIDAGGEQWASAKHPVDVQEVR
ncbi:hypothetical protein DJ84_18260 [Halorubrum ezzemoulense]|nr:hypothetical protein DJ84_18260 [Halorubrum ezzemoulense]